MPDYNIYIHSSITASSGEATKPWSSGKSSSNSPWGVDESLASKLTQNVSKVSGVMLNPDSLISQGIGAIAKAVPWVALVYVVAKTIDKVATTCINYGVLETGDYRDSINYNNFKSQFSWLYKPFSNAYNEMQAQNKFRIDDYRKLQQRQLLGDSVINTYTNRGV